MKKLIIGALMAILLVPGLVLAANPASHLYLYEKDADWEPVEDGAWGKMTYKGDNFVFNGHGLTANTEYTLVRYDGTTWPTIECLTDGTSNNGGNINLEGDIGSYGDKVWLVLSSDVDCDEKEMIDWNPTEYLFENNLLI